MGNLLTISLNAISGISVTGAYVAAALGTVTSLLGTVLGAVANPTGLVTTLTGLLGGL